MLKDRRPSVETLAPSGLFTALPGVFNGRCFPCPKKMSITTLLTLLDTRQVRLAAACKEIADWVDHQGGHPTALRIRDRLNDIEKDTPLIRNTLSSLKPVEPPLPRFR